ncbi:vesicle-associated membrane protein 7 [Anopheles aquasalis]|uniref:vesicle-associated membrane protein 7 n=1 Tax=Anopheles aquasalis TaxID=42839 RepID=UPI00215A263B|nr:vesicle-associated membrane protein 7 [Anopheles aquasalis]
MPIIYSAISRGQTVLAKYADCVGNFTEVAEQIIDRMDENAPKLTYKHGNYLIHLIRDNQIIYMCITDDKFELNRAFAFLMEVKNRFTQMYGLTVATAIAYAMNTEFSTVLSSLMSSYSDDTHTDTIGQVKEQIDELRTIMVKNIEGVIGRGERIDRLETAADGLLGSSTSFRQSSRRLSRAMFWRSVRMYVLLAAIVLFMIYVIVSMACGGLLWQSCLASPSTGGA